jgi:hypothetical protein
MNLIKPVWEGKEPPNPCLQIPDGEIDVYSIIAGRRRLQRDTNQTEENEHLKPPRPFVVPPLNEAPALHNQGESSPSTSNTTRFLDTGIIPGKGWQIIEAPIGNCDGTYDSNCNWGDRDDCLLANYNSG